MTRSGWNEKMEHKKKDLPRIPEEDFTEEDIKYINEPFSKKDLEWLARYEGKKWQTKKSPKTLFIPSWVTRFWKTPRITGF